MLNRGPFTVSGHEKTSVNLLLTFEDIKDGKWSNAAAKEPCEPIIAPPAPPVAESQSSFLTFLPRARNLVE